MTPYYEQDGITIYHGDCREVLSLLDVASVDLVLADPPYYRVKDEPWDRQWDTADGFLSWLADVFLRLDPLMTARASLYCFASPQMGSRVESLVSDRWHVLNRVRWTKVAGWHQKSDRASLRSFLSPWEDVIFAERLNPIGAYLHQLRVTSLMSRSQVAEFVGVDSRLVQKWEEEDPDGQHSLITEDQFVAFSQRCGAAVPGLELRGRYQSLRRPFSISKGGPDCDIWTYEPVMAFTGKHPCEKPIRMCADIVEASSLLESVVLDPFMGSGTTLVAAKRLGRKAIGIELNEAYCEIAAKRLSQGALPLEFSA